MAYKDLEKQKRQQKRWRQAHPEYSKEYARAHPEQRAAINKKYYDTHAYARKNRVAYQKKWYQKNKKRLAAVRKKRKG